MFKRFGWLQVMVVALLLFTVPSSVSTTGPTATVAATTALFLLLLLTTATATPTAKHMRGTGVHTRKHWLFAYILLLLLSDLANSYMFFWQISTNILTRRSNQEPVLSEMFLCSLEPLAPQHWFGIGPCLLTRHWSVISRLPTYDVTKIPSKSFVIIQGEEPITQISQIHPKSRNQGTLGGSAARDLTQAASGHGAIWARIFFHLSWPQLRDIFFRCRIWMQWSL